MKPVFAVAKIPAVPLALGVLMAILVCTLGELSGGEFLAQAFHSPIPSPTPILPQTFLSPLSLPGPLTATAFLPVIVKSTLPKGVGLTYGHCEDMGAVGAAWQYGWSPNPPDCPGVENVPMIWGQDDALGLISGTKTLSGNSPYILGFNEPDLSGQAHLTAQQAADLWYQIEVWRDQYHPDKKLVAPVPSHIGYDPWLPNFYNAFVATYHRPPRLDALAAHCYQPPGSWSSCQPVVQWFENKAAEWNIPGGIWVTEYGFPADGCTSPSGCNWPPGVTALNSFTDWLKTRPLVRRYAWFAARIIGNEPWWGNPDTTTRLIQCPTSGDVSCTPGILSPFGTAYLAK